MVSRYRRRQDGRLGAKSINHSYLDSIMSSSIQNCLPKLVIASPGQSKISLSNPRFRNKRADRHTVNYQTV